MEELKKISDRLDDDGKEALKGILDYLSVVGESDEPSEVMMDLLGFIRFFQAKHILDQACIETEGIDGRISRSE